MQPLTLINRLVLPQPSRTTPVETQTSIHIFPWVEAIPAVLAGACRSARGRGERSHPRPPVGASIGGWQGEGGQCVVRLKSAVVVPLGGTSKNSCDSVL